MRKKILILGALLLVLAAVCAWAAVRFSYKAPPRSQLPHSEPVTVRSVPDSSDQNAAAATSSLGSAIYQQASDPIQNKLPDANPVSTQKLNPFQGGYQNPF